MMRRVRRNAGWESTVVDALATFRLVRLTQRDSITQPVRDKLMAKYGTTKWSELLDCPWCLGMWVALGVVLARTVHPRLWAPISRALAFSAVTGLLSEAVDLMENA